MGERIILTGAGGFVGGVVFSMGRDQYELHGVSSKKSLGENDTPFWHPINVLDDFSKLEQLVSTLQPKSLIHAAAMADIDSCERNQTLAWRTNVELTERLIALCETHGRRLVYLSTDTVFDGNQGNYHETDPLDPVNFYGKTKQAAEQRVADSKLSWAIVRLSLVMGFSASGEGNSFLDKMDKVLREGKEVGCPDNEIRTPIDARTLAEAILELAGNDHNGIYHLAGTERLTRYELGQRLAGRLGYDPTLVVIKNSDAFPGRAPRPRDVSLNLEWTQSQLSTQFKSIEEGMDHLLRGRTA